MLLSMFGLSAHAVPKKKVYDVIRLNCSKDFGKELDLQAVIHGYDQRLQVSVAKELYFGLHRFPSDDPEKSDYHGEFKLKFDGDAKVMQLEGSEKWVNSMALKITGLPETFSYEKGAHDFTARLELNGTACKLGVNDVNECKHAVSLNTEVRCSVYMTDTMQLPELEVAQE